MGSVMTQLKTSDKLAPVPAATAATAGVTRAELLLSGNGAQALVDSVTAWSGLRLGVDGCALWAFEGGRLRLLARGGQVPLVEAEAAARRCLKSGEEMLEPGIGAWPLSVERRALGVLTLAGPASWNPDAAQQVAEASRLLAQRLPAALELERLHRAVAQLAEAERLQRALYAIAELASGDRDMGEVLSAIHGIVAGLMYAENFYIALYDRIGDVLRFPYFRDVMDDEPPTPQTEYPMSGQKGSLTAHVIGTGQTLMGPSERLAVSIGCEPGGFGPQSADWLGVPLLRGAEVMGAVVVQSYDEARRYSDKERALLTFVAQHIATALERKQAHDELELRVEQRTDELRELNRELRAEVEERLRAERLQAALFRIAELGSTSGSVEEFYAAVHGVVGELLFARNFYIALLSDDGGTLNFPYSVDEFDQSRSARRLGRGLTEYVLRTGRALLADRATIEALQQQGEVLSHGARAAIWLGVPLICDERTVGVLAVQSYDSAHRYSGRDQELLTFVSYHIANALQRKRGAESLRLANAELEQRVVERTEALFETNRVLREQIAERERAESRLRHAALHDALTGLPNRAFLLGRLAESLERYARHPERRFAVLFLDLDRFKVVNDSVGHLVGDELLKEAGARIAAQLEGQTVVARLGGDEFAVLLDPITTPDDACALAGRIIAALDEPIRAGGKDLYSSTSIGIAIAMPHYTTGEELLRDADVALYRAKARGRRRYEMFDETLRREALHQLELEGNLRRALARNEFEPVFQPILDLGDGRVVGYEALLRWRHPIQGLVAPGEFLAQAEESGLAEAIDWQVYESAFAQAHGLIGTDAYIGINVGARHLRSPMFIDDLMRQLDRYELSPRRLRIEVTERALLEDPDQVRKLMEELGELGVRIALDDFGTGYSSLSYLHRFPLHALKIDRSFVSPIGSEAPGNTMAVLRAIHALGASLGLEIIAEGIETPEQLQALRGLGCAYGQGFLLARPQPASALRPATD
jgi:diguanylate cyclase (GGDEF)-like protein